MFIKNPGNRMNSPSASPTFLLIMKQVQCFKNNERKSMQEWKLYKSRNLIDPDFPNPDRKGQVLCRFQRLEMANAI